MSLHAFAPTFEESRIAISLSREELYVVMRLLKAQRIPGFSLEWLGKNAEQQVSDEMRHELEVATNALAARGYLSYSQESAAEATPVVKMPSYVIALVGTCAFSELGMVFQLRTTQPKRLSLYYLHKFHDLYVMHTMLMSHIHQFEAITGKENVLKVIDDLLELAQQVKIDVPEGAIFSVHAQAARDAVLAGSGDEALKILVRGGLPAITAQAFADAIRTASLLCAITVVKQGADHRVRQASQALVITPSTCFTLLDRGDSPVSFLLHSISAAMLRSWFDEQL